MRAPQTVLLEVGLTGGIASGKSTVGRVLELHGVILLDADKAVHGMLRPGCAEYDRIVARFGEGVLHPDRAINRRALGHIVFSDTAARSDLNAILHPAVQRREAALRDEVRRGGGGIVVTDAALLVETGSWRNYDRLVVVSCDPALQISRLMARDPKMDEAGARARISTQAPLAEKLELADYVIETSGSLAQTEAAGHDLVLRLREDLDAKRAGSPLPTRRTGKRSA